MNGQVDGEVDYRRKYKNLKRKLKFLIYEQECFQEELRRAQRKLLKVSRDKSFLLDRILQYENVDEDSSDSDVTASSDNSDTEGGRGPSTPTAKRKRSPPAGPASPPPSSSSACLSLHQSGGPYLSAMSSPPYTPFPSEYLAPLPNSTPPKPERSKRDRKNRGVRPKKPKLPLGSPPGCGGFCPSVPALPVCHHFPPLPNSLLLPQSSAQYPSRCSVMVVRAVETRNLWMETKRTIWS